MQAPYETGMRIIYDAMSKRATVAFRGRLITLPQTFETPGEATAAGEAYCRSQGWIDRTIAPEPRSLLKHRQVLF